MERERFNVKYIISNNCFVYVSAFWFRYMGCEQCVIEIWKKCKLYYFTCFSRASNDRKFCINATFARSLQFYEGEEVFLTFLNYVPSLNSINIVPYTEDDRELLELQREKIQSNLLNQVRVVANEQPIVVWISKFSSLTVIVENLKPQIAYGSLQEFTEVHMFGKIANKPTKEANINEVEIKKHSLLTRNVFKGKDENKNIAKNYDLLHRFCQKNVPWVFRVLPLPKFTLPDLLNAQDINLSSPCHILVPRRHLPKNIRLNNGAIMCKINKVSDNLQNCDGGDTNISTKYQRYFLSESLKEPIVRIYVLEDIIAKCSVPLNKKYFDLNSIHSCGYVSEYLINALNLKTGSRIIAQAKSEENIILKPTLVDILFYGPLETEEVFKDYVQHYAKHPQSLLLNSSTIIFRDDAIPYIIKLSPASCTYTTLEYRDLFDLTIRVKSVPDPICTLDDHRHEENLKLDNISIGYLKNILMDCEIALDLSLSLRRQVDFSYDRENILICGSLGSGKTTICKILMKLYRKEPCFVHTCVISCRTLKGKTVEKIQKIVKTNLSECVYYQPSIIFLDDLENITNASLGDEENTVDAINASRVTDMLLNTITHYQKFHYISIVATCASVNNIGLKLRPTRGAQFFKTVLSVPNLEKADRINILQLTLKDKFCVPEDMNWNYYGNKTEGWMPQDLVDLAEKAKFVAWKRHAAMKPSKSSIVLTEEDINTSLENSTPLSMHDVQLYKNVGHSWSDIGGLTETKNSLTEILQWPLKYPEIFKNAPIKLQSGVLLFGMPGTGKTMLAKAIAGECGVNLISIKGPELLSKYIGVSEESVRNVFERARSAKPCVLFFDEFDSLAPRRGHDSTGVTDRVVNQLLTQLDGVEDREGVAVVAASSRPDLLDPALLRPGRLDKCLHCPMPKNEERKTIFAVLCNSQKIDTANLDLEELARLSPGFTGADINAAITQARLSAYEDALATAVDGKIDVTDIKVTQMHLVKSVECTKPSLSKTEKLKYSAIYARFSSKGALVEDVQHQKATLA